LVNLREEFDALGGDIGLDAGDGFGIGTALLTRTMPSSLSARAAVATTRSSISSDKAKFEKRVVK